MMNPAWPERIVFGRPKPSLENDRKTCLPAGEIR
jgi:hypothetical protein